MAKVFGWLDRAKDETVGEYEERIRALAAFHGGYAFFSRENYHAEISAFAMYAVWNGELNAKLEQHLPSGGFMLHCDRERAERFLAYPGGYPVFLRLRAKNGRLYAGQMILVDREEIFDFYYNGCEVIPPEAVWFHGDKLPAEQHFNELTTVLSYRERMGKGGTVGSYSAYGRGGSYRRLGSRRFSGSFRRFGSFRYGGSYRFAGSFRRQGSFRQLNVIRQSGFLARGGSFRRFGSYSGENLWEYSRGEQFYRGSYRGRRNVSGSYWAGVYFGYLNGSYPSSLYRRLLFRGFRGSGMGSFIGSFSNYGISEWELFGFGSYLRRLFGFGSFSAGGSYTLGRMGFAGSYLQGFIGWNGSYIQTASPGSYPFHIKGSGAGFGRNLFNGSFYGGSYQLGSFVYGGCVMPGLFMGEALYLPDTENVPDDAVISYMSSRIGRIISEMGYGLDLI